MRRVAALPGHQLEMPRTAAVMETIERFISPRQLRALSGVGAFSFNAV